MKRAAHALRLEMDGALREAGLTTPQYAALCALEEQVGLSGAGLARRCFVTPQTMNGILTKLEAARLVERREHPEHGRILQTYITEKGSGLIAECHRKVVEIEERMVAGLEEDDRLRLSEMLRGCADSLESARKKERGR